MPTALNELLRNPAIWRVGDLAPRQETGIATEYPALDEALPDAGWPPGALSELLTRETGVGELSLIVPSLRAVCAHGQYVGLVAPPYLPHARALQAAGIRLDRTLIIDTDGLDALWAAEQMLRAGVFGMVVVWATRAAPAVTHRALQRLHIAAGAGRTSCLIYRNVSVQSVPSPASLRLFLSPSDGRLRIDILKRRGALRGQPIFLRPFPAHWHGTPAEPTDYRSVAGLPRPSQSSAA